VQLADAVRGDAAFRTVNAAAMHVCMLTDAVFFTAHGNCTGGGLKSHKTRRKYK
jgi:hypothetical protein